jgi:hypothetical protein
LAGQNHHSGQTERFAIKPQSLAKAMQPRDLFSMQIIKAVWPFLLLCLLLGVAACSSIETPPKILDPLEARTILKIPTNFNVKKAVHDKITNTTFVMTNNQILIYRQQEKINSIGRLGFTQTNFNKLSDITLSPTGSLLALDGFRRIIYRYDQNGSLISQFAIKDISKPALLVQSNDEKIFIYDEASNEVFILDPLAESDLISFGKFTFRQAQQIARHKNQIYLYDTILDKTFFYNTFGQQLEAVPGKIFMDQFQKYQLEKYFFTHQASGKKFCISPQLIEICVAANDLIVLIKQNEIAIVEMVYAHTN